MELPNHYFLFFSHDSALPTSLWAMHQNSSLSLLIHLAEGLGDLLRPGIVLHVRVYVKAGELPMERIGNFSHVADTPWQWPRTVTDRL